MSPAGAPVASRVLVVGSDADVSIALHLHLERAGFAVYCLPGPTELEAIMRVVAPHAVVLVLPAAPDSTWGTALTAAAGATRVGVRIVMVGPSRDLVEPLAAVAGAERAFSRAEVLARPLVVVERALGGGLIGQAGQQAAPADPPLRLPPMPPPPPAAPVTLSDPGSPQPVRSTPSPAIDLLALIDEELVDEPRSRPQPTRVEVNVSLVSEHNFYVGATRRIDSGGVFIATALPAVGGDAAAGPARAGRRPQGRPGGRGGLHPREERHHRPAAAGLRREALRPAGVGHRERRPLHPGAPAHRLHAAVARPPRRGSARPGPASATAHL